MSKAVSMKAVFEQIGYRPHSVQRQIHQAAARSRFRFVTAGRRTGKSVAGGHEFMPDVFSVYYNQSQYDGKMNRWEAWIVGPNYTDAEKEFRVVYSDIERLGITFDKPGTYYDATGGNMHISLFGGKFQIHAKSGMHPESLVGEGLRKVVLSEAAKLKPSIWYRFIRPTLADYHGGVLATSTPEGKNWYYDEYLKGLDESMPEYYSLRMPSWTNPYSFPLGKEDPEILSMATGMSAERFNQEIGASFEDYLGSVFKNWDEALHVGAVPYDPELPVFVCTDYGFTNPAVMLFLQIDVFNNVRVIEEFYQPGLTNDEFADSIKNHPDLGPLAEKARLLYPDPEDPGASRTLSQKLRLTVMPSTGGLIKDRIELIRTWLKMGPNGLPKMRISTRCPNLIGQMGSYHYPEENATSRNISENPVKKDDHAVEALGRFFAGHFGRTLVKNSARQRAAHVRR